MATITEREQSSLIAGYQIGGPADSALEEHQVQALLTTPIPLDFRDLGGEVSGVFPGQPDGVDFFGLWLVEAVA